MKIALLAPIAWRVPPRHYGPWERVVGLLAEGLVARGVDVTLFATADSLTTAHLAAICPHPYAEDRSLDPKVWECLHIASLFERAAEFDLIHNHFDFLPLSYGSLVATPLLTTIHGFSSPHILPVYQRYNHYGHYVAISKADRHPSLKYRATIYHGIAFEEFTLRVVPEDYLLFFGRIHPDKGVADAIAVARRSKRRLIIAGIIQDEAYFDAVVKPALHGEDVRYVGSVGATERNVLLGGAYALLHLIHFDEPFGLSMVEAMACGTPVIAYRRGSVPEIVSHGETGVIVDDLTTAVTAVSDVGALERSKIRDVAAARFGVEQMVEAYLQLYKDILYE